MKMKILWRLILLLLKISTASAEIYQYQYSNGLVIYSDQVPNSAIIQGYKKIQSQKKENITLSQPVPAIGEHNKISMDNTKVPFTILTPEQNQTFRNVQTINMKFTVDAQQANASISVYLDDKLHLTSKATTLLTLENLSPGSHTVYATLHDQHQRLLHTSTKISFYILPTTSAN